MLAAPPRALGLVLVDAARLTGQRDPRPRRSPLGLCRSALHVEFYQLVDRIDWKRTANNELRRRSAGRDNGAAGSESGRKHH